MNRKSQNPPKRPQPINTILGPKAFYLFLGFCVIFLNASMPLAPMGR